MLSWIMIKYLFLSENRDWFSNFVRNYNRNEKCLMWKKMFLLTFSTWVILWLLSALNCSFYSRVWCQNEVTLLYLEASINIWHQCKVQGYLKLLLCLFFELVLIFHKILLLISITKCIKENINQVLKAYVLIMAKQYEI